jgi:hypothetical protein
MPSQYFDTANHKKFQCDFAFKADEVPMLQTPDQAKIYVNLCDPFSRAMHRRWVAMGYGRRTQISLLNVHLVDVG